MTKDSQKLTECYCKAIEYFICYGGEWLWIFLAKSYSKKIKRKLWVFNEKIGCKKVSGDLKSHTLLITWNKNFTAAIIELTLSHFSHHSFLEQGCLIQREIKGMNDTHPQHLPRKSPGLCLGSLRDWGRPVVALPACKLPSRPAAGAPRQQRLKHCSQARGNCTCCVDVASLHKRLGQVGETFYLFTATVLGEKSMPWL